MLFLLSTLQQNVKQIQEIIYNMPVNIISKMKISHRTLVIKTITMQIIS